MAGWPVTVMREHTGERDDAAESHRLKGVLVLQQSWGPIRRKQEPVLPKLWQEPKTNKRSPSSDAPPPAWRVSTSARASGPKRMRYWPRSTAGSPRALRRPTYRTPKHCWRSWRAKRLCTPCRSDTTPKAVTKALTAYYTDHMRRGT